MPYVSRSYQSEGSTAQARGDMTVLTIIDDGVSLLVVIGNDNARSLMDSLLDRFRAEREAEALATINAFAERPTP